LFEDTELFAICNDSLVNIAPRTKYSMQGINNNTPSNNSLLCIELTHYLEDHKLQSLHQDELYLSVIPNYYPTFRTLKHRFLVFNQNHKASICLKNKLFNKITLTQFHAQYLA
jgi:hypothetical protein